MEEKRERKEDQKGGKSPRSYWIHFVLFVPHCSTRNSKQICPKMSNLVDFPLYSRVCCHQAVRSVKTGKEEIEEEKSLAEVKVAFEQGSGSE